MQDLCNWLWFSLDSNSSDYSLGVDLDRLEHDFLDSKQSSMLFLDRFLSIADRVQNRDHVLRSRMLPHIQENLQKLPRRQTWLWKGTIASL